MTLREQILEDIKSAMKAREEIKLSTLRQLNSSIKNREIEMRPEPINEGEILNVIKKAIKQRKEAIEQYVNAARMDLADKETAELGVLESYLPEQLSEADLVKIIKDVVRETGASSMKDMKLVMPQVIQRTQGAADNKLVSQLIKTELGG